MGKLILIAFLASATIAFANDLDIQNFAQADQQKAISAEHGTTWLPLEGSTKTMLIFHGLHESPHFMRNWADFFFKRGYNVLNVRLDGHFQPAITEGLKKVQSEDWIKTAETAYKLVSNFSTEVSVLGFSTGGTLAAHLSLSNPGKIKNMFLISPAFGLSNQVFLSSTFMSPMGLTSKEICRDKSAVMCRFAMSSDPEFKVMVQNGLEVSPQAGYEVQELIQQVFTVKTFADENLPNVYMQVLEKLNTISSTVTMANSEVDAVVDTSLSAHWMKTFKGQKSFLSFKAADKIGHIVMNKNFDTRFETQTKSDSGYNVRISEIENLFDKTLSQQ